MAIQSTDDFETNLCKIKLILQERRDNRLKTLMNLHTNITCT